jgi:hypothetical protein
VQVGTNIFAAIDAQQPIRHKDPENFKTVVTGLIPVDKKKMRAFPAFV